MNPSNSRINPTSWAVKGDYAGLKYEVINVTPLLAEEKILFSVTTEQGELHPVDVAPFPTHKQTEHLYYQTMKRVVGLRLGVLL